MVHRFFIEFSLADLKLLLGIQEGDKVENEERFSQNYNIRTLEYMPILTIKDENEKTIKIEIQQFCMRNDKHNNLLINSRIEDVELKFKSVVSNKLNRCILVVDGYYEWTEDKKKIYAIKPKDSKKRMFLGALKMNEEGNFVVFTLEGRGEIGKIHPRMPLFIKQEDIDLYLSNDDFSNVRTTISKYNEQFIKDELEVYRIGENVNDQKDRSKNCLLKFDEFQKKQDNKGIKRFFSASASSSKKSTEEKVPLQKNYSVPVTSSTSTDQTEKQVEKATETQDTQNKEDDFKEETQKKLKVD